MYKIMYVAIAARPKPFKVDNVNHINSRRWNGVGDVVTVASKLETDKLLQHTSVFIDVTGWDDDKIKAKIADLQDRVREARRAADSIVVNAALETASVEELESQLRKRRHGAGVVQPSTDPSKMPKLDTEQLPRGPIRQRSDGTGRPQDSTALAEDIMGAIARLDTTRSFDKDGQPLKEHVEAILEYPITEAELSAVFIQAGGA